MSGGGRQRRRVAASIRKAQQARALNQRPAGFCGHGALPGEEVLARAEVSRLGQHDLIFQGVAAQPRHVEMAQAMVADLEVRIGNQLRGALFMRLHPFAAGEERGLDPLRAEEIDDAPVITRDVAVGLAEIEGEGDELFPGGKFDAPDGAAQRLGPPAKYTGGALASAPRGRAWYARGAPSARPGCRRALAASSSGRAVPVRRPRPGVVRMRPARAAR